MLHQSSVIMLKTPLILIITLKKNKKRERGNEGGGERIFVQDI